MHFFYQDIFGARSKAGQFGILTFLFWNIKMVQPFIATFDKRTLVFYIRPK